MTEEPTTSEKICSRIVLISFLSAIFVLVGGIRSCVSGGTFKEGANHALIVIFVTIGLVLLLIFIKKERERRKWKEERKKIEEERKRKQMELFLERKKIADTFYQNMTNLVKNFFILIDTNIWMNENNENIFLALEKILLKEQKSIVMLGPQFDEICNIKNRYEYDEIKSKRARCALTRIERFQKSGLLSIKPITLQPIQGAYADPLIIKLMYTMAKKSNVCFISDDKELRIRLRQLLDDDKLFNYCIIGSEEIWYSAKVYLEIYK